MNNIRIIEGRDRFLTLFRGSIFESTVYHAKKRVSISTKASI